MNKSMISLLIVVSSLILLTTPTYAVNLNDHPKLVKIADELVANGLYSKDELQKLFAKVSVQESILEAMRNPAEYKFTWGKYRKIFIKDDRIQNGVNFWNEHEATLKKAEQVYGVPAHIIVAIIGVESKFGRYKGKHKVLESLVTLVTGYPRRSDFFAKELKDFLLLTKENNFDAESVLGSYAGAVGFPQFISSSYRNLAVDFSGDGKTDLIDQPIDAIGSVANYFKKNGWLTGQPVTSKSQSSVAQALVDKASRDRKIQYTAKSLRQLGANLSSDIDDGEKLNVLMLDASEDTTNSSDKAIYIVRDGDTVWGISRRHKINPAQLAKHNGLNSKNTIFRGQRLKIPGRTQSAGQQPLYFYTHENFYVITRYNHSVLYAMAVHELSQAIRDLKYNQDINRPRQEQQ